MSIQSTSFEGLYVSWVATHEESRSAFRQTYRLSEIGEAAGRPSRLAQPSHFTSAPVILRGFHPEIWDKFANLDRGKAIANRRTHSVTVSAVEKFELRESSGDDRLFVSHGLGNTYCVIIDEPVDYLYDVTEVYRPVDNRAVAWDEPDLGVDWQVDCGFGAGGRAGEPDAA